MDAEQNEENATVLRSGRRGEQGEVSLDDFQISQPDRGMINLLGIESPGLTSSLAIAEQVARMVQEDSGMAPRTSKPSSRQDRVSAPGHLNDWA
jgi:L-2-hydroxyglutarate oxidase LhgO